MIIILCLFQAPTKNTHVVHNICEIVKMDAILLLAVSAHFFCMHLFHRQHNLRGRIQFKSYVKKNQCKSNTLKIEQTE